MSKLFISFSTTDGTDIAKHVYTHYKKSGWEVFYSPEEIPYGKRWPQEIKKHIEECDMFLIIATTGALESEEVYKEISEAKRLEKLIIPCKPVGVNRLYLETWDIDLEQGPEFSNEHDLVRKIDLWIQRGHNNEIVFHNKGKLLGKMGRYGEAIVWFDRALSLNPNNADLWNNKGVTLFKLRKLDEALECYEKALSLNPNNPVFSENKKNANALKMIRSIGGEFGRI